MTTKWGFGVAMPPVVAVCFYQAPFGRTVLPKWPLWAHSSTLCFIVFQSGGAFALPAGAPKSHMRPLPHLGVSENDKNDEDGRQWHGLPQAWLLVP